MTCYMVCKNYVHFSSLRVGHTNEQNGNDILLTVNGTWYKSYLCEKGCQLIILNQLLSNQFIFLSLFPLTLPDPLHLP